MAPNGTCVACLLRGGLDDAGEADAAATLRQSEAATDCVFGDFEIARRADGSLWELGRGAMGVTYRAVDTVLHRDVALKVIETPSAAGGSQAVRERFLREARAAAALRHPNVAGVFHLSASPNVERCYFAMELVEGETLEARVRRDGPVKAEVALEIAIQVTRALMAAAARGLIHRDLKPGNIMLAQGAAGELEVKVIDFGLAKAAAEAAAEMDLTHGGFVGTPAFASPEQFKDGVVDVRSDIYALGATLWFALTGRVPFSATTVEEMRISRIRTPLPVDQLVARKVPSALIALLRSCLAVDPADRPATARELMETLDSCRPRRKGHKVAAAILVAAMVIIALLAVRFVGQNKIAANANNQVPAVGSAPVVPAEKSIAVLPLENLSDDKENAFFADGLQDDILTSLARIGELRVISRTSVSQYRGRGAASNLREIARALGVDHVLEGSVRRVGNRVLVNVQLIDARNDRHLWAERYDRTLEDSLGLQGELATHIASALQARLAPEEKASLSTKPTGDAGAYALYLRALGRERAVNQSTEDRTAAEHLYAEAIALDPKFALAHARLSIVNSHLAFGADDDRSSRTKARVAAEESLRLSPSLGEAHMAIGLCLYFADKDYAAALTEFSIAATTSPNEPDILRYIGWIYRRQGRWRESLAAYDRAQELDPRNLQVITGAALDHVLVRDWGAATAGYNRALEIAPDSAEAKVGLAYLEVFRNSNPAAGRRILQKIPAGIDPDGMVTEARWDLAMLERDYPTAEKILADFPGENFAHAEGAPKTFFQGRVALARGDAQVAQRLFTAAAQAFEEWMRDHPDDPNSHVYLARVYAYMGRKEDAIREARRAVEVEPENQNAFHGAARSGALALVYALTGEADQAIILIERLLITPGPVQWPNYAESITLADLRLRWEWDSLRSDPRFQKILAGSEPKTIY
jgi:TolB-like protein/Tfp pilus assembly protein PilF